MTPVSFPDKNGIIQTTYDTKQAEMLQSSLMAQHIISRVKQINFMKDAICIIKITDEIDINSAIDFI